MNMILLDVRTPDEWRAQHIEGSQNIPIDELLSGRLPDAGKDTQIYTYCRTGNRSGMAQSYLQSQGFTNAHNAGSIQDASKFGRVIRG